MTNSIPSNTATVFREVLQHIQQARHKIFRQANTALIDLYWQIGLTISHKVQSEAWGKGVVTELAHNISQNAPDIKGFSDKNLWRMKQFYETYQADEKLASLAREFHPDIQQTFKDQYVLEFLGHSENDLQTALIQHMKAFILELGSIPLPASRQVLQALFYLLHPCSRPLSGGGTNRNQFPPLTRKGLVRG